MGYFDILKTIEKVLQDAGKIELYPKLLEAYTNLSESQHENAELKARIKALEEKIKIKDELIFRNNAYWKKYNNDGPFCMRCRDKNIDLIRMVNHGDIQYYCPECKQNYLGPNYKPEPAVVPIRRRRDWSSY